MIHKPFELHFAYKHRKISVNFETAEHLHEFHCGFFQTMKAKKCETSSGYFIELVAGIRNTYAERGSLFFYKLYNFWLSEFTDINIREISIESNQKLNQKFKLSEPHDEG